MLLFIIFVKTVIFLLNSIVWITLIQMLNHLMVIGFSGTFGFQWEKLLFILMSLRVQCRFLSGRARKMSISYSLGWLFHLRLRLWWRWHCFLDVIISCGVLAALVLCRGFHTSTPWPDIRLNTNPCSSHPP